MGKKKLNQFSGSSGNEEREVFGDALSDIWRKELCVCLEQEIAL
jgi:hypothetical protein